MAAVAAAASMADSSNSISGSDGSSRLCNKVWGASDTVLKGFSRLAEGWLNHMLVIGHHQQPTFASSSAGSHVMVFNAQSKRGDAPQIPS